MLSEAGAVLGRRTADATGVWQFMPSVLGDGQHTIVASETDAAGNTGSASVTFVLDSTIPYTDYTLLDAPGVAFEGVLTPYQGSEAGVERQFVHGGTQGTTTMARADNTLVRGGPRVDAIVA